jgi:hypothetical protein
MKTEIDNPPAFPRTGSEHIQPQSGMDLRDYFAAKALSNLIPDEGWLEKHQSKCAEEAAKQAYVIADAMLKARTA